MAGAYTLSCPAGLALTARLLRKRVGGRLDDGALRRTYGKLVGAAGVDAALGWFAARGCAGAVGTGTWPTAVTLAAGTLTLGASYLLLARLMNITELRRLPGMR
jgi:putative peptidoglycan lipid II flippase